MMKPQRRITKTYFDFVRKKYISLIYKIAFRVGANETQAEEMRISSTEELLKCMICYDGSGSFMTFLYGRLFNVFRHMRDAERRARRIHNTTDDFIKNIPDDIHDIDCNIMVQECMECLNDKERIIIMELFFNGKTIRELSKTNRMAISSISRIKTKAIRKMKRKCGVNYV